MRRRWTALLVVVAIGFGTLGCGPRWAELPEADVAAIEAIVAEVMAAQQVAGVSVAVEVPGRGRLVRSWGVADRNTGEPLTPAHHLRVASVTKTFTAVAVLRLVEQGRLGLDDPLEGYVPGVPHGGRITIRHLLAMRAGTFELAGDADVQAQLVNEPGMPRWRPEHIVDVLRRNPPAAEPDQITAYSNSNYVLLGLVIERVTGRPAEEVIAQLAVRPVHLGATSFPTTPDGVPAPAPRSYLRDPATGEITDVTPYWTPKLFWTAGGMVSTIEDLTDWSCAVAYGVGLRPETVRAQQRFTPLGGGIEYGLGVARLGGWLGHNGIFLGDTTFAATLPPTGTTVAVYANSRDATGPTPADLLFTRIAEHLHPGSTAPAGAGTAPAEAAPVA